MVRARRPCGGFEVGGVEGVAEARLFKRKLRGFAAFASDEGPASSSHGVIETLKM